MIRARKIICVTAALAGILLATSAQAQDYPTHPVKIVVGTSAGSGPDVIARTVAAQLAEDLGQQFIVENRPGANTTIATRTVAQAQPDGYTLLFSSSSVTPTPYIYKKAPYNLVEDLAPIATTGILDGYLMLVNPESPVKTVPEFIAYAKANRVLYGSPGVGNSLHLVAEIFRGHTGIAMEHVIYKGAAQISTALMAKEIQVMFVTPPSVVGLVKSGKLRAIGYTGHKPFPEFPDVPLIRQILPGFDVFGSWGMFLAPAKTPPAIINKLNAAIQKALTVPKVANVLGRAGYVPDGRDAAQTAAFFRKEVEGAAKAVKAAKINPI